MRSKGSASAQEALGRQAVAWVHIGHTQSALARRFGVHPLTVAKWMARIDAIAGLLRTTGIGFKTSCRDQRPLLLIDETGRFMNPVVRRTPLLETAGGHRKGVTVIGFRISPTGRWPGFTFVTEPDGRFHRLEGTRIFCGARGERRADEIVKRLFESKIYSGLTKAV